MAGVSCVCVWTSMSTIVGATGVGSGVVCISALETEGAMVCTSAAENVGEGTTGAGTSSTSA